MSEKLLHLKQSIVREGLIRTVFIYAGKVVEKLYKWMWSWVCLGRTDINIDPSGRVIGTEYMKIGRDFHAGRGFWLEAVSEYRGQELHPQIIIGDGVSFSDFGHVGAAHYVKIGNHVLFGSKCYVTDHNHGVYTGETVSDPETPPVERALTADQSVIIEDNVWVGDGVAILPGVTIGRCTIIGTNAVVTKDLPPYTICVGIPARPIKKWNPGTRKWEPY